MSSVLVPTVTNGNGHHQVAAAAAEALTPVAFKPKLRDWQFVRAYMDAIEKDGRCSHEAIAKHLNITRQAVWAKMQRPEFVDWLNAQVQRATDNAWPLILQRASVLALRGSIDHMNFIAKTRGEFKQHDPDDLPPGAGGPVFNVNILVPRP
jgi:hypothetical protein